jgi:hypothetical protein
MITLHYAQGSPEWKKARSGRITASKFHMTRASALLKTGPNKGEYSSAAKDYAFRLAIERISGEPLDEGFEVWSAARGHELEPEAREEHEIQCGVVVEPTGFVITEDGAYGASLDGNIGDDGAAEYKCFLDPQKLRDILLTDDWSGILDQAQGGLWITGRKWIDICLYCPALRPIGRQLTCRRFMRNDDYIEALERDLVKFKRMVDCYEAQLRSASPTAARQSAAPSTVDPTTVTPVIPNIF